MTIEHTMYFALGFLVATVLALMILPRVWKRAVRLTTKRIEAATPITLAEFRADKDQLRAEHALQTRRLEMTVETLRRRLADQLTDVQRKSTDLAAAKTEREAHAEIVRELEAREAEARRRILELEKEGADTAQRLRMRDREYADKLAQLEALRDALQGNRPAHFVLNGQPLTGVYNTDVEALLAALATERARAEFLDNQARTLIAQAGGTVPLEGIALPAEADPGLAANTDLVAAEARIADAEDQLNRLLSETAAADRSNGVLLADKLKQEDQLGRLKTAVLGIEQAVLDDFDTDRFDPETLRERLGAIAAEVSSLVYSADNANGADSEESLFERVQKFANDSGSRVEDKPVRVSAPPKAGRSRKTRVGSLTALRKLQGRN